MKKVVFQSLIKKEGINPYVDPPLGTAQTLGYVGGVVPVRVLLEGKPFKANLMPLGAKRTKAKPGTHHRLYLHGLMRKTVGKDFGDPVKVVLAVDKSSRAEPMNPAFAKALKKSPRAKAAFARLSPSHQKELNRYLNHLKSPEALSRNLFKIMDYLLTPRTTWFGKKK
jgi:Bacteriocin-protection, YdeI or OmpD-Associated/Domain of unknown function (DUF1905)